MDNRRHLALIYDSLSLKDVLRSALPLKNIVLICPISLAKELTHAADFKKFKTLIPLKHYLLSGELDLTAYELYQKWPYHTIIAPYEGDILRAARLRQMFNLPGPSYESALIFRDKILMKSLLSQKGFSVPAFQRIETAADILAFIKQHGLPAVIKPSKGTGSESISILKTQTDVHTFLKRKDRVSVIRPFDLEIETFVEGGMYHINGLVLNGDIVASWPSIYPQQSIEMMEGKCASSYLLSETNDKVVLLNTYAKNIVNALPTPTNTAFHLEVFVTASQEIIFCEIASRVGGKGVRDSWLTSFDLDLGKSFVEAQAEVSSDPITVSLPIKPKCLTGEIWFPKVAGTLKHIEATCPFPWVKDYQVFSKSGDRIKKSLAITECLSGIPLLIADNESEMQQRLHRIMVWFQDSTQWE